MIYLSTLLMSLFITLSLIPLFKSMASGLNVVDLPSERKVHQVPVPKIGGIAMALGILFPSLVWFPSGQGVKAILAGSSVIVAFGFLDDVKDLGYGIKFLGQIVAALVVMGLGGVTISSVGNLLPSATWLPRFVSFPLTLVVIVGVTNAVNLSDGLDGLAGGIIILCFLCLSYLAYSLDMMSICVLSLAVIGAVFGFLRFNTHPASIFMGDTGSQLLGFLAITLSIYISQNNEPVSPLFPMILLGFPILDTLTVMTGRIVKGQSPFKADKSHFHHRLMDLGLYHSEAVFVVYVLQSSLVSLAYIFRFYSEWHLLITYLLFAATVISAFHAAGKYGWYYRRNSLVDLVIKGKLKEYRDKQILIKASFYSLKYFFLAMIIVTALIPEDLPQYMSIGVPVFALLIFLIHLSDEWNQLRLRYCFYLITPFLMYFSEDSLTAWEHTWLVTCYDLSFGILTLFMLITLKFTRRKKGFKPTPHDYLILFITVCLPLLINFQIIGSDVMKITIKTMVFLFGYEVLAGELRNNTSHLSLMNYTIIGLLFAKYIMRVIWHGVPF